MQFDTSDFVYAAWSRIQRHALASRKPVLMFVAASADAAAASLSLRRLLEATLVRVEVHFVSSLRADVTALLAQQAALVRAGAALESDDDSDADADADPARAEAMRALRAYQRRYMLLFVGCGAGADLGRIIDWDVAAEAHILDPTRPVHLATLRAAADAADFILADARRAAVEDLDGGAALALQPPPEGCALSLWGYDEAAVDTAALLRVLARAERSRLRTLRAAAAADRRQSKRLRHAAKKRSRRADAEAAVATEADDGMESTDSRRRALQRRRLEGSGDEAGTDGGAGSAVNSDNDADPDVDHDDDDATIAEEADEESDASADDVGDDEDEDDDEDGAGPDWRYGVVPVALEARYYSAVFAGRSAAMMIYELSERLGQSHVDAVWCAAVGCADLFARGYCDAAGYDAEHQRLVAAAKQVAASRRTTAAADGVLRDIGANLTSGGDKQQHAALDASGRHVHLVEEAHPRLFLLRPGTLWSALWYSTPVAAALRLHHPERGAEQLRSLLARVGVSVDAARAPWMALPAGRRSSILRDLRATLHSAGVPGLGRDITTPCLARSTGYSHAVTAFDACEVFYACITAHPGIRDDTNRGGTGGAAGNAAARQAAYRVACRTRFDVGVAALMDAPDGRAFRIAVDEAHQLREAVAEATAALMQRGALRATAHALVGTIGRTQGAAARAAFWDPPRLSALARHLAFTAAVSDPSATAAAARAAAGGQTQQQAGATWRKFAARPLVLACTAPEGAEGMLGGGASVAIVYAQAPFGARDAAAGRSGAMVERPGVRIFATTAAETGAPALADALPERGGLRLAVSSLHDGICGAVSDARVLVATSDDAASQIVDVCALGEVIL